jgi:hypothetical protein
VSTVSVAGAQGSGRGFEAHGGEALSAYISVRSRPWAMNFMFGPVRGFFSFGTLALRNSFRSGSNPRYHGSQ